MKPLPKISAAKYQDPPPPPAVVTIPQRKGASTGAICKTCGNAAPVTPPKPL